MLKNTFWPQSLQTGTVFKEETRNRWCIVDGDV